MVAAVGVAVADYAVHLHLRNVPGIDSFDLQNIEGAASTDHLD